MWCVSYVRTCIDTNTHACRRVLYVLFEERSETPREYNRLYRSGARLFPFSANYHDPNAPLHGLCMFHTCTMYIHTWMIYATISLLVCARPSLRTKCIYFTCGCVLLSIYMYIEIVYRVTFHCTSRIVISEQLSNRNCLFDSINPSNYPRGKTNENTKLNDYLKFWKILRSRHFYRNYISS